MESLRLPLRVEYAREYRGTVRFFGPLLPPSSSSSSSQQQKEDVPSVAAAPGGMVKAANSPTLQPYWFGVEWDDASRGKHSGQHPTDTSQPPLFTTTVPNSATFIKCTPNTAPPKVLELTGPSRALFPTVSSTHLSAPLKKPSSASMGKLRFPRTFLSALREKYGNALGSKSGELQDQATGPIVIGGKEVESVGWEKMAGKLKKLSSLREVSLVENRVGWLWGQQALDVEEDDRDDLSKPDDESPGKIAEVAGAIEDLDLSRNLFSSWAEIGHVTSQLPKLESLRLSHSRFVIPLTPADSPLLKNSFTALKALALGYTQLSWAAIEEIAPYLSALEALHFGFNGLTSVKPTLTSGDTPVLASLKLLNLECNQLESFSEIAETCKLMAPNIETLYLTKNLISVIPESSVHSSLLRLQNLNVSDNKISDFMTVHALNSYECLTSIRLRDNPVMRRPNRQAPTETVRVNTDEFIARLGRATTVNGSEVTKNMRLNAELYYLTSVANTYAAILVPHGDTPPANEANLKKELRELHPRFEELVKVHGMPAIAPPTVTSTVLKDRLLELNFVLMDGKICAKNVKKKVPLNMTLRALRALAGRLVGVHGKAFTMSGKYVRDELGFPMDDEMREVSFYDFIAGDEIQISLN